MLHGSKDLMAQLEYVTPSKQIRLLLKKQFVDLGGWQSFTFLLSEWPDEK